MESIKVKFLFLSFLFTFLIFQAGCGGTVEYTATIIISGVEKEEHAEAFKVTTKDFGILEFTQEDFDNNTLTGTLTLSGKPSATLVVNNDLFEGEYLTELETLNFSRKVQAGIFEVILSKTVANWNQLSDTLDDPHFKLIILGSDITLEGPLLVERPVNFDLGGYSLINEDSDHGFNFSGNFQGTLKNGYLVKADGYAGSDFKGLVVLEDIEFSGFGGYWIFHDDAIFNDVRFNPSRATIRGKLTLLDSMYISFESYISFSGNNAELQGNGNEVGCGVGGISFNSPNMLIKDVEFAPTLKNVFVDDDAFFDGVTIGAVDGYLGIWDGRTLTFSGEGSTIADNLNIWFGNNQSRIVAGPQITNRILVTEFESNPNTNVISFKLNQDISAGFEITIVNLLEPEPVNFNPEKFNSSYEDHSLFLTVKDGETISAGTEISIEVTNIREWVYFEPTDVIIDSIIFSTWPEF